MSSLTSEEHGPGLTLAQGEIGAVSVCGCGVVTVTLQYLSLRFEPAAFRELQGLISVAQRRLDNESIALAASHASVDVPPVH